MVRSSSALATPLQLSPRTNAGPRVPHNAHELSFSFALTPHPSTFRTLTPNSFSPRRVSMEGGAEHPFPATLPDDRDMARAAFGPTLVRSGILVKRGHFIKNLKTRLFVYVRCGTVVVFRSVRSDAVHSTTRSSVAALLSKLPYRAQSMSAPTYIRSPPIPRMRPRRLTIPNSTPNPAPTPFPSLTHLPP